MEENSPQEKELRKDLKGVIEQHFGKIDQQQLEADVDEMFRMINKQICFILKRDYAVEPPVIKVARVNFLEQPNDIPGTVPAGTGQDTTPKAS